MSNAGTIERKATIFNVQKYNMYDGPGIRTLVFFKGCPLRCKWCANPEGLEKKVQIMFKEANCTHCGACIDVCPVTIHTMSPEGKHTVRRDVDCIGCGRCVEVCPARALTVIGEAKSISELLKIIEEDRTFYELSEGGGVTLGGGEVTMQPEAAISLLSACKQDGINTAIETCGYTSTENILKIAPFVDLFLFDIKHMNPDRHMELTGVRNELILENLTELLHKRYNVHVRMPMLKGINDSEEELDAVVEFLMPYKDEENFKGIDLLPYHKMGVGKYAQLGKEYPIQGDPALGEEDLTRIEEHLKKFNFPVNVIRH